MRVERRYLNKKLREATENEWWTKYLKRASEQELLDFSGASNMEEFNSDICSSCEDLPGYNAKHIDWLIPKDEYFDALADDGYDIIELCEMDGKQFLGYMVGGRLYDIGDEVKECCGQSVGPNESLNESNNVIDFLKKIKFGDEFDFEEVGDWGISAWTSRPLLNFSNGFYIVQLDNDKLNKHFVIPDNETEDEFIRNRDSFIKRHFNDLNESVKGMQRANRKTGFLNEASYGGAFDIEDDQFFTRDDINEFGYDIADQFSAWADSTFDLSDVYMDTPTKLHLEVLNSEDYEEYGADIKIDMRRIRSPKDLYRYEDEVLRQLKDAYFEYHAEDEMEI